MFLSKLRYSELVQRLFEKMTFFRVDPLPRWCCASCPRLAPPPPSGTFTTLTPRATGGRVGYLLRPQPSSLIKAMKYSGIPAQTSRLTAGLGGSRPPSSMWIVFRTTFSPRGSTSWPLRSRGTHSACRSWRNTFPFLHRLRSSALTRSPFLPLFLGSLGGAFTLLSWGVWGEHSLLPTGGLAVSPHPFECTFRGWAFAT